MTRLSRATLIETDFRHKIKLFLAGDYFLSHSLSCTSNKENAVGGGGSVMRLHHGGHMGIVHVGGGGVGGAVGGNRLSASRVWTPEDPRGSSGGGGTSPATATTRPKRGS